MWERGLKLLLGAARAAEEVSLPMWERGLKLRSGRNKYNARKSLPMWERGLKPTKKAKMEG